MQLDMRAVLAGAGAVAVVGGVAAFIFWRSRKREKEPLDEEKLKREAIERIEKSRDLAEAPSYYEGEAVVDDEDEEPYVPEGPQYRIFPEQEKPELDEIQYEEPEEAVELDEAHTTMWGTDAIEFDEAGRPLFRQSDFEGEVDRIEEVYQEDYNDKDDYVSYSRDYAVWFPNAGVMVNGDLEPLEVVDAVGPTMFSKLVSSPDRTFFAVNHEMEILYELTVNNQPLEEVMAEVYPTYNTSTDM